MENLKLDVHGPILTNVAYYAGYIDGEGCFDTSNNSPRIRVNNTYPKVLYELKKFYGGTVRYRTPTSATSRPYFVWRIQGKLALEACRSLIPFLREKKEQALILLEITDYPAKSAKRLHLVGELKRLKRIEYGERESSRICTD